MTIFDVLQFAGWILGAILGAKYGQHCFGTTGGVVGGIVGLIVGHFVGRLPFALAWAALGIRRKSPTELRKILDGEQYFIYHFALAGLMAKNEDIEMYRPKMVNMLVSPHSDERQFAWVCVRLAFPDIASQLKEYDPLKKTELCQEQVRTIGGQLSAGPYGSPVAGSPSGQP